MNEVFEGVRNMFIVGKGAFESLNVKVNLGNAKEMLSRGITNNGLHKRNVYPCATCGLKVKTNSLLCVQ